MWRAPDATSDLDSYAGLGNRLLGTTLLAAAYVAVLQLVVRDRPLAVEESPGGGPAGP